MEFKPFELKTKTTPDENWDYARIVEWSNNDFDQADRIWEQLHKDELAAEEAAEEAAANEKSAVAAKNNMNGYADYLRRNNANRAFTSRDAAKLSELPDPVDNEVADTLSYGRAREAEADAQIRNQLIAKIADIENRIAELDGEIEEASKPITKKGLSDNDLYKKIAANEMRKWNSSDPTSFWRWEKAREDTKEKEIRDENRIQAEKDKANKTAKDNARFTIESSLEKMNVNRKGYNRNDQNRWLDELSTLKAEALKHGDFESLKKIAAKQREIGADISVPADDANNIMLEANRIKAQVGKQGGYTKEEAKKMLEKLKEENYELLFGVDPKYIEMLDNDIAKFTKSTPSPQPGGNPFS